MKIKVPSIVDVSKVLVNLKRLIDWDEVNCREDEDERLVDVRLNVQDDGWSLLYGPSDYDQDHRGFWGVSCISSSCNCVSIARELIWQVKEHIAMFGEED